MRTYAGHSSAAESNALYRRNLAKGQTGLSVAFDLPTQTGYDPDSALARGEVGKVGVPIPHLGEMRRLFDDIPLTEMNTSMTINATAMWLLALYQVVAEEQADATPTRRSSGPQPARRHHAERHHQGVPLPRDLRVPARALAAADDRHDRLHGQPHPEVEPDQHLQLPPAGGRRDAGAGARLRALHRDGRPRRGPRLRPGRRRGHGQGRRAASRSSSTPASGSSRRPARCAPSCELWDEITRERYGVDDEKMRRFRYGVQVNSLGLTEAQPENNVQRIVLEMLGVTLSKNARARAVQLPAWNEALGLPRPWDQQWSLRLQQVLAFESDLLEYDDLFDGSHVVEAKVADAGRRRPRGDRPGPGDGRRDRRRRVRLHEAGAGLLARRPPGPHRGRRGDRRRRQQVRDDRAVAADRRPRRRDPGRRPGGGARRAGGPRGVAGASATTTRSTPRWTRLAEDAKSGANLMEATLAAARAGATTGEWAGTLREVFGEYRAPTGVSGAVGVVEAGSRR